MSESFYTAVVTALITGGITLIGVYMQNAKSMAVIETKIDQLTVEVEKHNKFAERIPVIEERIQVANHRIADLENKK